MKEFNVIIFDVNTNNVTVYDVMPYFYNKYKELKPKQKKEICSYKDIEDFLLGQAMYMFWARCEWEILVTGFPISDKMTKLDVYGQIKMNKKLFVETFIDNIKNSRLKNYFTF